MTTIIECRNCGVLTDFHGVTWGTRGDAWRCVDCERELNAWDEFIIHAQEQGEDWCPICCEWFYIGDECSHGECRCS